MKIAKTPSLQVIKAITTMVAMMTSQRMSPSAPACPATLPIAYERVPAGRTPAKRERLTLEVTDDKNLPMDVRKQRQIDHAPYKSDAAALVKLADKTCNLRDVASAPLLQVFRANSMVGMSAAPAARS
ncbi:MAG TPA: hypothetical protein VMU33_20310 [Burkholderiaceae bacterium]|nr:hypothetical protein [Burkholderiaceae bacterium]